VSATLTSEKQALARAVYCRPDLILLDDIFSGLDRKSLSHIFREVIGENGILAKSGTAVILVTHSTQFLSRFDTILVVENGTIAHSGSYDDLLEDEVLNDQNIGSRAGTAKTAAKDEIEVTGDGKVVLKNPIPDDEEIKDSRTPSELGVYSYFLKSCGLLGVCFFFVLAACVSGIRSFESKSSSCPVTWTVADAWKQVFGSRFGLPTRTRRTRLVSTWECSP